MVQGKSTMLTAVFLEEYFNNMGGVGSVSAWAVWVAWVNGF